MPFPAKLPSQIAKSKGKLVAQARISGKAPNKFAFPCSEFLTFLVKTPRGYYRFFQAARSKDTGRLRDIQGFSPVTVEDAAAMFNQYIVDRKEQLSKFDAAFEILDGTDEGKAFAALFFKQYPDLAEEVRSQSTPP